MSTRPSGLPIFFSISAELAGAALKTSAAVALASSNLCCNMGCLLIVSGLPVAGRLQARRASLLLLGLVLTVPRLC